MKKNKKVRKKVKAPEYAWRYHVVEEITGVGKNKYSVWTVREIYFRKGTPFAPDVDDRGGFRDESRKEVLAQLASALKQAKKNKTLKITTRISK